MNSNISEVCALDALTIPHRQMQPSLKPKWDVDKLPLSHEVGDELMFSWCASVGLMKRDCYGTIPRLRVLRVNI